MKLAPLYGVATGCLFFFTVLLFLQIVPRRCDRGWILRKNRCYDVIETPTSFVDAFNNCTFRNSHMLLEDDYYLIDEIVPDDFESWVGLCTFQHERWENIYGKVIGSFIETKRKGCLIYNALRPTKLGDGNTLSSYVCQKAAYII